MIMSIVEYSVENVADQDGLNGLNQNWPEFQNKENAHPTWPQSVSPQPTT